MEKLRVVQIGTANYGAVRRWSMRQTGLFELLATYDRDPTAMEKARQQDGARPTASIEELLDTPGAEAAIISTGAVYHGEQIRMALERGLHVFTEKPVCASMEEVRLLMELEREHDRVIGVGHWDHEKLATSRLTRKLINDGTLGDVVTFHKTTAHGGGLKIQTGDWRGLAKNNPGGMLFQCGVHGLHELMHYFGPVTEVSAFMRHDIHTTETADVAICNLRFKSGLIGSLHAYHITPYIHSLQLFGTRANLYRDERHFEEGTELLLQKISPEGEHEPRVPLDVDESEDRFGNIRSFYRAIREGTPARPSLRDGLRAVQVVFAAETSAQSGGQPIPIPELETLIQ